jgi:uncharacterized membrane protein
VAYDEFVSDMVKAVELAGAAIMVAGGMVALIVFAIAAARASSRSGSYEQLRQNLARVILLGLEVLIMGDIVRTIIVDPTLESVAVLGLIVIIRIVLSFSLEVEVDGTWPWARSRVAR